MNKSFEERKKEYFEKLTRCYNLVDPMLRQKYDFLDYCKIINPSNEKELFIANMEVTYNEDLATLVNDIKSNNIKNILPDNNQFIKLLTLYYDYAIDPKNKKEPEILTKVKTDSSFYADIQYEMLLFLYNKNNMINFILRSMKLSDHELLKIIMVIERLKTELSIIENNNNLNPIIICSEFHKRCEEGRINKNIFYTEPSESLIRTLFPNK